MPKSILLAESNKVRIEMEVDGERALVRLVGVVDEDVDFGVILSTMQLLGRPITSLTFDLGGVERMNSAGVREWLMFHERHPKSIECIFANVSQFMIEQATVIPNILGHKQLAVVSFQSPYYCSACQKDLVLVLRTEEVLFDGGKAKAPSRNCPTCSGPLRFDWLEDEYFAFLKRAKRAVATEG